MKLKINGKQQEIKDQNSFSLAKLIEVKGLNCKSIVVEYNHEIISQQEWEKVILKQDDIIEIVSFVGGG